MRKAKNQTIYDLIHELAPFDSQEEFDNAGFLVGDPEAEVRGILVALDATPAAVREAVALDAQLLVVHHPVMFHAIKELRQDSFEGRLLSEILRSGLSLIAAHTNLDQTRLSGAWRIAEQLQLQRIRSEGPYLVLGELRPALSAEALMEQLSRMLRFPVRCYGDGQREIRRLAIAGGAYCEGYSEAMALGAQALLTGEVRHHNAVAASSSGFVILDGGHEATEAPMMVELARYLQKRLNELEYSVRVYASQRLGGPESSPPKEET